MDENKICPRCHSNFECKVGDITKCQCYTVKLNDAEREFLARTYNAIASADWYCSLAYRIQPDAKMMN